MMVKEIKNVGIESKFLKGKTLSTVTNEGHKGVLTMTKVQIE